MNKLQKRITRWNIIIMMVTLVLYFVMRIFNTFLKMVPVGDENSFLATFKIFTEQGYSTANIHGNSIVFNLVSSVFNVFSSNELLSLRMTSLFFGILSLLVLYFFIKRFFSHLPKVYQYVTFLTAMNVIIVMSFIFAGINDSILAFLTLLFFWVLFTLKKNEKDDLKDYFFLGIILAMMLLTRKMSVLLLAPIGFVLMHCMFSKHVSLKKNILKLTIIGTTFFTILFLFNIPSVFQNKTLSFHEKKIENSEISWHQLQYLTAINLEKGKLPYGKHNSIEEVEMFLLKNGPNSLPNSFLESLTFDVARAMKTFFREFVYLVKPFTRLLGALFLYSLLLFSWFVWKRKISIKKICNNYIFVFSLIYISMICLVVSTYVEPRWFLNIFLLLPILFASKLFSFKQKNNFKGTFDFVFLNLQLLSLLLMNLPYLYKNMSVITHFF